MKSKQFLVLVILAIVLSIAGVVVYNKQSKHWQHSSASGEKVLNNFPVNDVAKVTITTSIGEVNLERKGDEGWTVAERDGFPADFEQVRRLVRNLWELKPVQSVPVGPSQLGRLQLVAPAKDATDSGTLVDMKDQSGKRIAAIILGKNYIRETEAMGGGGFPAGRYVMPMDESKRAILVSETFSDITAQPERWINRGFFEPGAIKSISVTGTTPSQQWTMRKESLETDWAFADPKPNEAVDQAKVPAFDTAFGNLRLEDVLPIATKPETVGLDKPALVKLTTFDGFTFTFQVGRKENDRWVTKASVDANIAKERTPGKDEKPEDKKNLDDEFAANVKRLEETFAKYKKLEGRIYLLPQGTFDPLFKDRSAFVTEKPAATPTPATSGTGSTTTASAQERISVTTPPVSIENAVTSGSATPEPKKQRPAKTKK